MTDPITITIREAESITIILPLPKGYSPNARMHHFAKASMAKRLRKRSRDEATVTMLVRGVKPPKWEAGTLYVTWVYTRPNWQPDDDNGRARLKPYQDGLVDAGIYTDDKHIKTVLMPRLGKVSSVEITAIGTTLPDVQIRRIA